MKPCSTNAIFISIFGFLLMSAQVVAHQVGRHGDHHKDSGKDGVEGLWSGQLEAGFSATSGNSNSQVNNAAADLQRKEEQWTHNLRLRVAGSAFNGRRNSESYAGDAVARFDVSQDRFLFATLNYFEDKFDSFNRSISTAGGFGFKPLALEKLTWDIYTGVGYSDQSRKEGDEDISGMTFLGESRYTHQFTPNTDMAILSRVEYKPENTFARNEASLDVAINSTLSLKFAYEVRYNSDPDRADEDIDTLTKANIVYRF